MPQTTAANRIDPVLSSAATEYFLNAADAGFIASRILPVFPTSERSGEFPIIPAKALLETPDTRRAPTGHYNRGSWEYEKDVFACKEFGFEEPIDDGDAKVFSRFSDVSAEEVAAIRTTGMLLRSREKRVADMIFNTSNFPVHNVATSWDDRLNCTPRANVMEGLKAVKDQTGLLPNVFVCSWNTFQNVIQSEEFKDWVKYTNSVVTNEFESQRQIVARYFGVGGVLVGNAAYDSANKGLSVSATNIWSDSYAMLARVATSNYDLKEPCIGRTFLWEADTSDLVVVDTYYSDEIRSVVVRARHYLDERLVFTGAGYLLGNLA